MYKLDALEFHKILENSLCHKLFGIASAQYRQGKVGRPEPGVLEFELQL